MIVLSPIQIIRYQFFNLQHIYYLVHSLELVIYNYLSWNSDVILIKYIHMVLSTDYTKVAALYIRCYLTF